MTRSFVVVGQKATAGGDFLIDDLPGTSGRIDVLVRCLRATLLSSHGLRRDCIAYLVLLGGPRAPRVLRVDGATAQFIRPDERALAEVDGDDEAGVVDDLDEDRGLPTARRAEPDLADEALGDRVADELAHGGPGEPGEARDLCAVTVATRAPASSLAHAVYQPAWTPVRHQVVSRLY